MYTDEGMCGYAEPKGSTSVGVRNLLVEEAVGNDVPDMTTSMTTRLTTRLHDYNSE